MVKEKRNFILLDKSMTEIGKYTGNNPRQAALKAANAGAKNIVLRETGVRKKIKGEQHVKLHKFTGKTVIRDKLPTDPAWMHDKVSVPKVKKIGTEWVLV